MDIFKILDIGIDVALIGGVYWILKQEIKSVTVQVKDIKDLLSKVVDHILK